MPRGKNRRDVTPDIKKLRKQHVKEAAGRDAKRAKELEAVLKPFAKKYGAGALMTVASQSRVKSVTGIATGWQEIDDLLTGETDARGRSVEGTGIGIPRGRIVEIFGPESSGKTTLTLHIIAAAQRTGGLCAFVDAEHALDTKYAANLGVDFESLILNQPDSGEQGIDIVRDLAASGKFAVVVVDSVAALEPEAEQFKKGKAGLRSVRDSSVAAQARLMSRALRSLARLCAKTNTLLIFTNQLREKIGVMFGNPETTPGGKALKFYASVRLDVRKVKTLKKNSRAVGHRARIRTAKNKAAPPFREVHADIFPNVGIKTVYGDPNFDDSSDDEEASDDKS